MLVKYKCYNLDNQPYIKDTTKHYEGKQTISGRKVYILTKDNKLRQSKNLKTLRRGAIKGWLLCDAYIVITYYYKYNAKTKTLYITLNTHRPLVCMYDTVYYMHDKGLLTKDELVKLKVFGSDVISKLTTKPIERVIYNES